MFNFNQPGAKVAALVSISLTTAIISSALSATEPGTQVQNLVQATTSSQLGVPFTNQERTQIINKLLANPLVARSTRSQRIRVLSVVTATSDKLTNTRISGKRLASVLVFNYSTNKATRFLVDPANGEVLRQEELRGRPGPSPEERLEAMRIIQADREHAPLLRAGGILEGGFIVDGPKGTPPDNRYIQIQLLTPNRRSIQRMVVVDLTTSTIASSSQQ